MALALLTALTGTGKADTRIVLRPDMVLNETAIGDASKLVDEQNAIGDPATGKGVRPTRPFFPGWTAWQYPVHVLLDLGVSRHLTHLFLYNESGNNSLTLSTGRPFAWKPQPIGLNGYQVWAEVPLNVTTRYLRFTLDRPTSLPEIALYADGALPPVPAPTRPPKRLPTQATMDQFIGTNAFIDDPPDKLAVPVGFVREYHNWQWDTEAPDKQVRFQPSGAAGGKAWFFDDYYARLKALGVTVCPAVQQSTPAYFPGNDMEAKPVPTGKSSENPDSYALHAAHLFQYAARYGSAPVAGERLQIAPDQPRRSGLGSLRYIENWNEPDKTWRGREGRFNPYELAAMCSADYDGDQGRLGKNVGVRNADPHIRLVMGGLAGIHLDYLRAMKLWADGNRNGDFPADVLNLHHYSSDGTEEQAFKTTGISPEADRLRAKFAEIVAWRNANLPRCEVWVTEFGYDTNPKSPLHAPAIGLYTAQEVQGMWLLRSYFALAAAGVDRAAMFMFRDTKTDGTGVFETCGLVTEKGQWTPKPSYFYLATLKKRLAGMRFTGDVPSGKPDVTVYRFTGAGGKAAYAVWCPTSDGRTVPEIPLAVSGKTATRIEFTNDTPDGRATPLRVQNGQVQVTSCEKPVLILTQ
jgi:hypothetical protein